MLKAELLKKLAKQLTAALPLQAESLKHDFETTSRRILTHAFDQFNLVTREEFDVQKKVLERTRKKLEALEKELHRLEMQQQKE